MPFIIDTSSGIASEADRRRIVRIASDGTITTVRDLETGESYQSVRGSFAIAPSQRKPTWAQSQRRYGGARQTGESHSNGEIAWKMLVSGSTADACLANFEAVITDLESAALDLWFEWRPAGATNSTYYELRGVPTWKPEYEWAQFSGARSFVGELRLPVAPLACLESIAIAIPSTTLPATIALSSPIPGNAPALADIDLTTSGGTAAPIWALFGWATRPTTPLASSVPPFGVIEAETAASLATWAVTGDADYRGSSGLQVSTSGAGTASATFPVDPSTLAADAFSRGELSVEVWARIEIASTVVGPKLFLSLQPFAGLSFGAEQFDTSVWGAAGKPVTLPSSGTRFRFVRLGTLNVPVDTVQPLKHNLVVAASWAAGSSGTFGLDELVLVPARQRALSPSGKPNDSTYPDFISSTGATTKTIRHELSGRVASGAGNPGRDSGLGGSLLELPTGTVDLVVKLSSLVADDPTVDATSEQVTHASVTGEVRVTPRVWLAG